MMKRLGDITYAFFMMVTFQVRSLEYGSGITGVGSKHLSITSMTKSKQNSYMAGF